MISSTRMGVAGFARFPDKLPPFNLNLTIRECLLKRYYPSARARSLADTCPSPRRCRYRFKVDQDFLIVRINESLLGLLSVKFINGVKTLVNENRGLIFCYLVHGILQVSVQSLARRGSRGRQSRRARRCVNQKR